MKFHYRTKSVKDNDKIFQYIQRTLFLTHIWPIFQILGAKKNFLGSLALSHTTSYRVLASCQNLERPNDTIPRKRPDRQKDGQMEGWKDG